MVHDCSQGWACEKRTLLVQRYVKDCYFILKYHPWYPWDVFMYLWWCISFNWCVRWGSQWQSKRKSLLSTLPSDKHYLKFGHPKLKSRCSKSLAGNLKLKNNLSFNVFNHIITLVNCFWLRPKTELVRTNQITVEWQS